jgi:hypothetical protein
MIGWVHCSWVCGKAAHHGRLHKAERPIYSMGGCKKRGRGRGWGPNISLRSTPTVMDDLPLSSFLIAPQAGDQTFNK